jgi:multidrug efflux system membrane fusion protein
VPSIAVQNGQKGTYVYVVNPDNTVSIGQVSTGPTVGDVTALTGGAQPGDTIVLSGQSRLTPGAKVLVTQTGNAANLAVAAAKQ